MAKSCLLLLLYFCAGVLAVERTYFIGIREVNWKYAPSNKNLINGKPIEEDELAETFVKKAPNRIGSVYKKAVYVQYTNETYSEPVPKPEWMGFLGPVIRAEAGDSIVVHVKNFADRPFSLHPHGMKYTKENEGAFYPDNTPNDQKKDDAVYPNEAYTYHWDLAEDHAPAENDEECVTRIYHSHIDTPKDIASGLIGPLVICKKGTLTPNRPPAFDYEFFLLFMVLDENISWYIDQNIKTFCTAANTVDKDDEDFQESNRMHSINGYVYGNLPGLSMCLGKKVAWYLFGIGNEVDIHSAFFYGQILTERQQHVDTISLFPATFVRANMVPKKPGKWLLSCQVNDHLTAGMQALFDVKDCSLKTKSEPVAKHCQTKHYYISAEEIFWNYGPKGTNEFTGEQLDLPDSESAPFFEKGPTRIGGMYKKAVYKEYTDETFTTPKNRTADEEHLGVLGPVIKAEVGDNIKVTFLNKASRPFSIQPHGMLYNKEFEGTSYQTTSGTDRMAQPGSSVLPGKNFTYEWSVSEEAGPTNDDDPDCVTWLYFSSVDSIKDSSSGLVGPLLVCRRNSLSPTGKQINVKKEFFMLATVFNENLSWYLDENIIMFTTKPGQVVKDDEDFQESNKMHSINGYMYGNQPGLDLCKEEKVSWHMIGLGSVVDIHGIYFDGNTFITRGTRRDTANLFPHISTTLIMKPDAEGIFELSCKTTDHYTGGMKQHYKVKSCKSWNLHFPSITLIGRTYYIAAVEVEWDFSPNRTWEMKRHHFHNESPGNAFLDKGDVLIGSKYKKVIYREYTDKTFTKVKERKPEEEHLEILGPLIHSFPNEKVNIVFKNMGSRDYSIHAHGVKTDSSIITSTKPGETNTYVWKIPKRSGPEKGDSECIVWAYYSHVNPVKDTFSGLIGPLVICRTNILHMSKIKNILEFALLFMVFDENESWYIDENIQTYCGTPEKVDKESDEFVESNKLHAINGKVYGNLEGLTMHVGDKVNWYLMGMGNEVDIHTAHFHGHSFDYKSTGVYRADVYDLFPGTFQAVQMNAKYPGTWLLHCHVSDHIHGGMETTYTVLEKEEKSLLSKVKDFFKQN